MGLGATGFRVDFRFQLARVPQKINDQAIGICGACQGLVIAGGARVFG